MSHKFYDNVKIHDRLDVKQIEDYSVSLQDATSYCNKFKNEYGLQVKNEINPNIINGTSQNFYGDIVIKDKLFVNKIAGCELNLPDAMKYIDIAHNSYLCKESDLNSITFTQSLDDENSRYLYYREYMIYSSPFYLTGASFTINFEIQGWNGTITVNGNSNYEYTMSDQLQSSQPSQKINEIEYKISNPCVFYYNDTQKIAIIPSIGGVKTNTSIDTNFIIYGTLSGGTGSYYVTLEYIKGYFEGSYSSGSLGVTTSNLNSKTFTTTRWISSVDKTEHNNPMINNVIMSGHDNLQRLV